MLFLDESTKYIGDNSSFAGIQSMQALVESMHAATPAGRIGILDESVSAHLRGSFSADEAGGILILDETTSAFAALDYDMLLCEAKSAVSGVPLHEGVIDDYWKKIRETIVKAWNAIKDWFTRTWAALTSRFQNAQKWLKENGSKISDSITVEVTTYPNIAKGKLGEPDVGYAIGSPTTEEDAKKVLEEVEKKVKDEWTSKKFREIIFGATETAKTTMTAGVAKSIVNGFAGWQTASKKQLNTLSVACNNAIKDAELAIRESVKQDSDSEAKKQVKIANYKISANKKVIKAAQLASSLYVGACSGASTLALNVLKAALRETNKSKA